MVVRTRFYLKKEVVSDNIAVGFVEANVDCVIMRKKEFRL